MEKIKISKERIKIKGEEEIVEINLMNRKGSIKEWRNVRKREKDCKRWYELN